MNYMFVDKWQMATIKGLMEQTGFTQAQIGYFLLELSIAILVAQKEPEPKQQEMINGFMNTEAGKILSKAAIDLWTAGGEELKQQAKK